MFKEKFGFNGEIKGSDLATRKNNKALIYFIDNILDCNNYCLNLYDKRFYISSLLCSSLLGPWVKGIDPLLFYTLVNELSFQDDDFYVKYLEFVENITIGSFNRYLKFLINYNYKNLTDKNNGVKIIATKIIDNHDEDKFMEDFMTFGWYDDSKQINVINLNSLAEFIFWFKENKKINNDNLIIIHDRIDEFKEVFLKELEPYNINLKFNVEGDYNQSILLEIADNIASLFTHFFNKIKSLEFKRKMFDEENKWNFIIISKLINKIGRNNIKYTIPIADWASLLSVVDIFSDNNDSNKNMFVFNYHYQLNTRIIFDELTNHVNLHDEVINILNK